MSYDDTQLRMITERSRALAEPIRVRMLLLLLERVRTVGEFAQVLGTSKANASRHVSVIERCGLVARERRGRHAACRLLHPDVRALCDLLLRTSACEIPVVPGVDAEDFEFAVQMGSTLLRQGVWDRAEWDAQVVRWMGATITPQLDLLRVASLRISRGETLDGLPLPAELLARASLAFAEFAVSAGTPLPEQ